MEYLLLGVIAVLGYFVYSLYTTNKKVTGALSALEHELLELPAPVHESILQEYKKREFIENVFVGDTSKFGAIAKRAGELRQQKAIEGSIPVSDPLAPPPPDPIKISYTDDDAVNDGSTKPLYDNFKYKAKG